MYDLYTMWRAMAQTINHYKLKTMLIDLTKKNKSGEIEIKIKNGRKAICKIYKNFHNKITPDSSMTVQSF